jgi:hypothetical protein
MLLLNDRKNHIFPSIEFVEKIFWQHWRSPDFAGGRWHLLGVGRRGSEGLLYMLRPQYDRAMMEIEDEDNQMMSKGRKWQSLRNKGWPFTRIGNIDSLNG